MKKINFLVFLLISLIGYSYTPMSNACIPAFRNSSDIISITKAMQSHQKSTSFYKINNPSIELTLSDGTSVKQTQINYLEDMTTGLDPGFDLGLFGGVPSSLSLYTRLVEDYQGIAFGTQALPNSDLESMIIPVGVKADSGKEITFSAEALNLPTNMKVFLEDKETSTFARLDETNSEYVITLPEALNGVGRFYLHLSENILTFITWDGSDSTDWNTAANWDTNTVPIITNTVVIPNTPSNQPVVSAATGAITYGLTIDSGASLTVNSGGSLIVSGDSTGNITYNLDIADTNWHLVSSPVVGGQYDDAWVTANSIASGTGSNRGIATYDNGTLDATTGHWRYFQAGSSTTTFATGVGYSTLRTASGTYNFTGTFPTENVTPAITQDHNHWNLLGNPYPSYLDIASFITENTSNLSEDYKAIYVWNGTSPTTGNYNSLTTGHIHPGQGFFINSNVASGTASITEAMQSHQTEVTFYRTSTTNPSIKLILSDDTHSKNTQIHYLEDTTKGLDPGFDLGMFNGTSSNLKVYTHLVEDNQGIAFGTQALPNSDLEAMVIPIGVKAAAGKEITFSVEALNLPTDLKVFLEDKEANIFTRLDEANSECQITINETLDDVGRFYLHTATSALIVDDVTLSTIYMYKSDISTLKIVGLPQGNTTVKLFNVLGKKIISTSFDTNVKDISLPKLAKGIYIAEIQTEVGKLNKKIIL